MSVSATSQLKVKQFLQTYLSILKIKNYSCLLNRFVRCLETGCDLEPDFVSSSARLPKSHQRGGEESFDRGLAQPGDDGGGGQVRRPAFDRRQQGLRRLCPAPDATLQSAEEAPPQIRIPGKFSVTTYLLSPIVITIAQILQVK